MRIAVSAVQGAFIEHEQMLSSLGVECFELRQRADLLRSFDGLVLPGGESTVQGKLLRELDMFWMSCISRSAPDCRYWVPAPG